MNSKINTTFNKCLFAILLLFFALLGTSVASSADAFDYQDLPAPPSGSYVKVSAIPFGSDGFIVTYFTSAAYARIEETQSHIHHRRNGGSIATVVCPLGVCPNPVSWSYPTSDTHYSLGAGRNWCESVTSQDITTAIAFDGSNCLSGHFNIGDIVLHAGLGYAQPPPDNKPTIESPLYDATVPIGTTSFSGRCAYKGDNKLGLFWRTFSFPETIFNITCDNNYEWTSNYDVVEGNREYFIIDYTCVEENDGVVADNCVGDVYLHGYDQGSVQYSIALDYPRLDDKYKAVVDTNAGFPLRFNYFIPPDIDYANLKFKLLEFPDNTFQGTVTQRAYNTLSILDEDATGSVVIEIDFSAVAERYFMAYLYDADDNELFKINFTISIVSDGSGQDGVLPDQRDLGFWGNLMRSLFVPHNNFIQYHLNQIDQLRDVKFAWYYQTKDALTGGFASLASASTSPPNLTINLYGSGNINVVDVTFIDPYIGTIKGWVSAFLWIIFAIFIVKQTSTILKS